MKKLDKYKMKYMKGDGQLVQSYILGWNRALKLAATVLSDKPKKQRS